MNATEIEEIKKILIKEIENTEKKIIEYSELCKPIPPENSIGRVSRMDAINNKSVMEAALREAKRKMQKLKVMKNKINDTDFGICIRCQQKIPYGRLMIRPESKYCVKCAE